MKKWIFLLILLLGLGGTTLAQDILDRAEINTVTKSVVYLEALDGRGDAFASGSGTIVEATGLIYTNHHVIEGASDVAVYLIEDMAELPVLSYYASIVQDFDAIDFAILQIDRDARGRSINPSSLDLPFIGTRQREISHGDEIHIFGFPDVGDGYLVLTEGTITTIENGNLGGDRVPVWYRTDATMSSGNSGGLVVDGAGSFVGIPTWVRKADSTMTQLGGILPITAVEAVLESGGGFVGNNDNNNTTADASLTLVNRSDDEICYVYLSPSTSTEWGNDYLGDEGTIKPGAAIEWTVEAGEYDMLLRNCEREDLAEEYGIDIAQSITLTYPNDMAGSSSEPSIASDAVISIEITNVDYEAEDPSGDTDEMGMKIFTYIRAAGYRGVPLRAGVFFYWENDEPISGENAHEDNQTPGGYLTHQEVLTPEFDDTEWTEFWFWMPYSAFPSGLRGDQDAYISASIDVDGAAELGNFSNDWEFTLFYDE